jgi:hypothetical protein
MRARIAERFLAARAKRRPPDMQGRISGGVVYRV